MSDRARAVQAHRRNIVTVSATITVPEGATTASFPVGTEPIHGNNDRPADISATYNGLTETATLVVAPQLNSSTTTILCASAALEPCLTRVAVASISTAMEHQSTLYTPELTLLAETTAAPLTATPAIAYETIWFAGQPLAQIDVAANEIHYFFNDHLGTPLLQTDSTAHVTWRAEYDPYGTIVALRRGESHHQPLRLPGQLAEDGTDLSYNVFRWYRAGWGRYTQADPIDLEGGLNLYAYANGNPLTYIDPEGLAYERCVLLSDRALATRTISETTTQILPGVYRVDRVRA